jgi:uncharacterized CHY-type Zn-finger protein
MGLFDSKKNQKTISLNKCEIFCCQCHQKLNDIWVKPEEKEQVLDNYVMCPTCFVELCERDVKNRKGE